MAYPLTPEQAEIVRNVVETDKNLAVIAYAGSGKTTTIKAMANALGRKRALCLAFNRSIAREMQDSLPSNCTASTLHSIGSRAWGGAIGKKTNLDKDKIARLFDAHIRSNNLRLNRNNHKETLDVINWGKVSGFLPSNIPDVDPIYTEHTFFDDIDWVLDDTQRRAVIDVSRESWNESLQGVIDFSDMVLCPTVYDYTSFGSYPVTFVDETQDLSKLDQKMISKLVNNQRLIIVGDPYQAIYEFRGAEENGMQNLIDDFDMTTLKLTVCFRCDQAIIENQSRAEDMKWRDGADMGVVEVKKAWTADDIPDMSAIICRNNAPLLGAFINLLVAGRTPTLGNKDAVFRFISILRSFGNSNMTRETALVRIDEWEKEALKKRKDDDRVLDDSASLRAVCRMKDTLGEAIQFLGHAANADGNITLSTIHKSKGLEYDTVFILDQGLIKSEGQEPNIRYVAETRARHELYYIDSEGYTNALEQPEPEAAPMVEEPINTDLEARVAELEGTVYVLQQELGIIRDYLTAKENGMTIPNQQMN